MNNKRRMRVQSLALGLSFSIAASSAALADDISIYITPPIEPINPNVLFVLDESGSMAWGDDWETLQDTDPRQRLFQLKSSLREIINSPDSDEVNAAIMGYQGVSSDTCPQPEKLGFGCFVPGINLHAPFLGIGDNRETLLEAVDALTHDGGTPTTSAVHDAIQWYKEGYDHHESPIEFWCQPNYVVLLSDGEPNFNSRAHNGWGYEHNDLDRGQPCDVRRETTGVNFGGGTGTPQDGRCTPDFVRYAAETDLRAGAGWDDIQNVTTHAIGFHINERTQTFLRYTAEEGGGNFFTADNSSALTEIITGIVSEAQASIPYAYNQTAIPFDSSNAATSENEIYVPLFLPEPKSFWRGNLKKYSLRINDDGSLSLLDAAGNAVLDSNGNFLDGSRSLWSASADGDSPVSGGAASRNMGARNLFTYIAGGASSTALSSHRLFNFTDTSAPALGGTANADITNSAMGVSSDTERADLLQWISTGQGYMGAPLHTHPTVIHYGSGNTVVYLLTSEGVLQAIDASTGDELWAYMPDELLGNVATIKHVVENPDENGFSGAPLYGLDGELTVVHDDANGNTIVDGGERVLAVFGMRRGGDNYYAIDISNRTNPSFAWEMIGGEGDFSRLGQTWAKAQLVKMELGASARDVLIIAGGYDSNQDAVTGGRAADTVGNAVYIVDAWNGRRLWWASNAGADLNIASMTNSVAASTNAIDVNGNGTADRIYLADTGGRIIRIDFFGSASAVAMPRTSGYVLADINGGSSAGDNRRFFAPPELAYFSRGGTTFIAVLIGSGRRPRPVDDAARDRFYMIKDINPWNPQAANAALDPTPGTIIEANLYDATDNLIQVGTAEQQAAANSALSAASGWYMDLSRGERSLAQAVVYDYMVFFTTYSGSRDSNTDPCTASRTSGQSYFYAVGLWDAAAIFEKFDGNPDDLDTEDRRVTLDSPGIAPSPTIMFPGDDGSETSVRIDDNIVLTGLEESARFKDRLHPLWWEEAIDPR